MKVNSAYIVGDVFGKMILVPYKKTKIGNHRIYLNDTGRVIIQMLEESASEAALCKKVAQAYDIKSTSEEYKQIEEFITSLTSMGVVVQN